MVKQLRLDVAQLTDVGRKREHNEDNMAYVIPKDQQVMTKKGALFIVADGMGGHAAGEVASEIAVDSVSNAYYQDDSDDIAASLIQAIKRANVLIHQRAAENMLRSGMGTTCVAAVMRGNMVYVANVGDSRAYLVRDGQVHQISRDHSWVAEQVRAGLLTEDQARTHAQRNVITRALGTQADVEIDIFPEPLEPNDEIVLCTDGLSGLVSDDDIRNIVAQSAPQESVYHLVERANANGGPDNITAIVIRVQDVGPALANGHYPVHANVREADEDTAILETVPNGSGITPLFNDGRSPSSPLLNEPQRLVHDKVMTIPQPGIPPKKERSRLFYPTVAILILFLLAAVGGGVYYYVSSTAAHDVDQTLQNAHNRISKAQGELTSKPSLALQDLATAQTTLRGLSATTLTAPQHATVTTLLSGEFTRTVKAAIQSYNTFAHISTLPCPTITVNSLNASPGLLSIKSMAVAQEKGKTEADVYVLSIDSKLYQLTAPSSLSPVPLPQLGDDTHLVTMASDGNRLILLWSQQARSNPTQSTYHLGALSAGQKKIDVATQIDSALLKNGQLPALLTASGNDIYVTFTPNSASTTVSINKYSLSGKSLNSSTPANLSVSQTIVSIAALPNNRLFFLLADGTVRSLSFAAGNQTFSNVFVQLPIPSPLTVSASEFTATTSVPTTPPAGQGNTTQILSPTTTSANLLVAGTVNTISHLYVMDVATHRILDLSESTNTLGTAATATPMKGNSPTPTSTGVGGGVAPGNMNVNLQLQHQYVSSTFFAQLKSMAIEATGARWYAVSQQQNAPTPLLTSSSTIPPTNCA